MPFYCYECEDCHHRIEKFFRIENRAKAINCESCGGRAHRSMWREWSVHHAVKPYYAKSYTLACNKSDLSARIENDKIMGLKADDYTKDGVPVFRSLRKHREYAKNYGFSVDKDGWY